MMWMVWSSTRVSIMSVLPCHLKTDASSVVASSTRSSASSVNLPQSCIISSKGYPKKPTAQSRLASSSQKSANRVQLRTKLIAAAAAHHSDVVPPASLETVFDANVMTVAEGVA